jgi:undecaprenyl-diphosphatase
VDWQIFHAVDEFSSDYKWLAHSTWNFETIGVVVYVLAVVLLWLATAPGEERRWKVASLAGVASAGISLGINQIIGHWIWHRPRPYESHPGVYHLTHSHDPSFPSDHASGAFGIAWGIYFVDRRIGRVFLAVATLISIGRLLVGAHYLSDVLASLVISARRRLAGRSLRTKPAHATRHAPGTRDGSARTPTARPSPVSRLAAATRRGGCA